MNRRVPLLRSVLCQVSRAKLLPIGTRAKELVRLMKARWEARKQRAEK